VPRRRRIVCAVAPRDKAQFDATTLFVRVELAYDDAWFARKTCFQNRIVNDNANFRS
jgi:hypothetical protein